MRRYPSTSGSVVILGGIVTSTALNMVVLPALYLRYGHAPGRRQREEPVVGATAVAGD